MDDQAIQSENASHSRTCVPDQQQADNAARCLGQPIGC